MGPFYILLGKTAFWEKKGKFKEWIAAFVEILWENSTFIEKILTFLRKLYDWNSCLPVF